MHFRILGPLWVADDDVELTPTAPKVRQVLAFLLVRCGKLVQVGELINELWGEEPPNSAMTTLQTYIYKLRKDLLEHCAEATLHTRVSGYLLEAPVALGDLSAFEALARDGRSALESGDPSRAADLLSQALAQWRGPALADVSLGEILSAHVTRLEEERLRVLELRITADLELGRHQQLVSELKMLVSEHPLNERFYAHLMVALSMSGRRYEALSVYRGLRRRLVDELGMEPSPAVQRLHLSLLNSGGDGDRDGEGAAAAAPAQNGSPAAGRPSRQAPGHASGQASGQAPRQPAAVRGSEPRPAGPAPGRGPAFLAPAQLPPDVPDFVGRSDTLDRVRRRLLGAGDGDTVGRAVGISGMPGAGKTVLALRAGHALRTEFRDGQLFADLRGSTQNPADPHKVLADFLRAVGVADRDIPATLQERGKMYRTWSMGRRMLVVLDDVRSVSQVTPLLPASPHSGLIVTTRWGLHSLPGLRHLELGELPLDEAVQLIEATSGRAYAGAERRAAERAADLCGRLPIALRSVGARLAATPIWSIGKLVARLEDTRSRLDLLAFADLDVRARLAAGYQSLDPADQSMLRLVSLLPTPDFSSHTAGRLVGGGLDAVEGSLLRLTNCHLLGASWASGGEIRYRMNDLVRVFARECLSREFMEPAEAAEAAEPAADAPAAPPRPAGAPVAQLPGPWPRPGTRGVLGAGRRLYDLPPDAGHEEPFPHTANGLVEAPHEG